MKPPPLRPAWPPLSVEPTGPLSPGAGPTPLTPSESPTGPRHLLQTPALGVGAKTAWALRAEGPEPQRLPDGRLDGRAYAQRVLGEIRRIKAQNPSQRCLVVFDLDNTLFDARARTLAVLKAFDLDHRSTLFEKLALEDIGWDAQATCQDRVPAGLLTQILSYWDENFWNGKHFLDDLLISDLASLAQEAAAAGAEVCYLSGRIESLRGPSLAQLEAAGLPLARPEHLVLKVELTQRTSPFKFEWLVAQRESGAFIGWFATDSARELQEMSALEDQTHGSSSFPYLLAEHPLTQAQRTDQRWPVLDQITQHLRSLRGGAEVDASR